MTQTDQTPAQLTHHETPIQEWASTARYGVRPAPDGLALVQDFLNTRAKSVNEPDLLADGTSANAWGGRAVRAWSTRRSTASQPPTLTDHDAAMLRYVRDTLDNTLAGRYTENAHHFVSAASFTATRTGEICWLPNGDGWRWFYSAILGEILLSQHTKEWQRIKQCRNDICRATIYDSSWNNSAIWHNRTTCDPAFAGSGVERC